MADAASSTGGSDTGSRGGENDAGMPHQGFLHETAPTAGLVCCVSAENAQQAVIAGDDDKDLLKQQGSLQDAVFGVSKTGPVERVGCLLKASDTLSASIYPSVYISLSSAQVLFTLSKEKLNTSWKYAMAVIILDFLQVSSRLPGVRRPVLHNHSSQAACSKLTKQTTGGLQPAHPCAAAQRVQLVPMVSLGIQ